MRTAALIAASLAGSLVAGALAQSPKSYADETAYLVNVTVRPGYGFADAGAALQYGYGLCDRMRSGVGYPQLMASVKTEFTNSDEYQASYLISQAAQELCPAMIWPLRQSAAGYRPPPQG